MNTWLVKNGDLRDSTFDRPPFTSLPVTQYSHPGAVSPRSASRADKAIWQANPLKMEPPLRILCIDGGGVRGISALYILQEIMAQVRRQRRYDHSDGAAHDGATPLKPCEFFDLICGTSTGGLIALMLGRLEMVTSHHKRLMRVCRGYNNTISGFIRGNIFVERP